MIGADAPSTGLLADRDIGCARLTGDSHGRTIDYPAQRRGDTKRRPRWWMMAQYNAANDTSIIKAGPPQDPAQDPSYFSAVGT